MHIDLHGVSPGWICCWAGEEQMLRALKLILLSGMMAAGPAATGAPAPKAKWLVFEAMSEGTIYIDPDSIRTHGNRADMWVLIDYKQPQPDRTGKQIRSDKLHYRYDCAGRQESILTSAAYAGAMATGAIVDTNTDPPKLTPVSPGTTGEAMLKRACGTAK
jgi:hypothetical protein